MSALSADLLPPHLFSRIEIKQIVDDFTPCWCWIGRLNRNGYARVWDPETKREPVAHRDAYRRLVGPIPEGKILDHRCRVRKCINPEHTEPVTHQINTLRGEAVLFKPINITAC